MSFNGIFRIHMLIFHEPSFFITSDGEDGEGDDNSLGIPDRDSEDAENDTERRDEEGEDSSEDRDAGEQGEGNDSEE